MLVRIDQKYTEADQEPQRVKKQRQNKNWKYLLEHIKDIWNLLDIARILGLFAFICLTLRYDEDDWRIYKSKSWLIIISWLSLLSIFRFFTTFRISVHLIQATFMDMMSFFIVLLTIVVSFTFTFVDLEKSKESWFSALF
jgi:uncharacterized Tic20 family protein